MARFINLEQCAAADFDGHGCCATEPRGCCPSCFTRWLRVRLLEHWRGDHYWPELDHGDFGILDRPFHPNQALVADLVLHILTGHENLTILTWALETGRPLDQVVEILTVLDINARRLPRFAWLLSPKRSATG